MTQQSKRRGAVLGAAIGDAMGHPTEFMGMGAIVDKWGPKGVEGFELWWERDGRRFAPYTDDTQMTEVVLASLIESKRSDLDLDGTMEHIAAGFIEWAQNPQGGHRSPGNACMNGCRDLAEGSHWSKAGGEEAGGCGTVMHAYPFGLAFADNIEQAEQWAVEHSKLTHRDPIALAACGAMAVGTVHALGDSDVETTVSEMIAAAKRQSPRTAQMMKRAGDEAMQGVGPEETLFRLRAWAAHEAIAAAVYIFSRHPDDPRAAILEGANTPGDSDSIATLAGALVGARCGIEALPADWVRDVERSTAFLSLADAIGG
jgi:ADP-ribosylglycohydrolase